MKLKWLLLWITLAALAGAACFGAFKRGTYTDISKDEAYLEEIYVGQIPEGYALSWINELAENLPSAPYIVRVTALDDMEYLGGAGRQLVQVEKVYQGAELGEGQEIYVTCRSWGLKLHSEPYSIERGFVNMMERGEEYLLFIETQVDGLGEPLPIYELYMECAIAPVFSYREHDNKISEETYPYTTYVRYNEVQDNEFFAETQAAMDALMGLKKEMMGRYD